MEIGSEIPNSVDSDPKYSDFGTHFFNPISEFSIFIGLESELYVKSSKILISNPNLFSKIILKFPIFSDKYTLNIHIIIYYVFKNK